MKHECVFVRNTSVYDTSARSAKIGISSRTGKPGRQESRKRMNIRTESR